MTGLLELRLRLNRSLNMKSFERTNSSASFNLVRNSDEADSTIGIVFSNVYFCGSIRMGILVFYQSAECKIHLYLFCERFFYIAENLKPNDSKNRITEMSCCAQLYNRRIRRTRRRLIIIKTKSHPLGFATNSRGATMPPPSPGISLITR